MTQYLKLQNEKRDYEEKQIKMIWHVTGLCKDLAKECVAFLQSYPELKFQTVGKSLEWLDFANVPLRTCISQDIALQCMMCEQYTSGYPTNNPEALRDSKTSFSPSTKSEDPLQRRFLLWCLECKEKCNRTEKRVYWCDLCNLYIPLKNCRGDSSIHGAHHFQPVKIT